MSVASLSRMLAVAMLAGVALSSCNCGGQGPCTDDAQCDSTGQGFQQCNVEEGICVCTDDRACGPNELCNAAGRCQAIAGCGTNDDCGGEGLFCDITSSQCLSVQECSPDDGETCCTLDSQCPFREVCDVLALTCVPGCRDNADCLLGEGCVVAPGEVLGQCGRSCTADNLCQAGELCNLSTGTCELDTRGPYCLGCTGGVGSDDCGAFGNYCLTDDVNGGEFCGVECAQQQACPSGYSCQDVIIIPPNAPFCRFPEVCEIEDGQASGFCSRAVGVSCTADEQCPEGPPDSDCSDQLGGRTGSCALDPNLNCAGPGDCPEGDCILIECRGSEGGGFGHCTCTRDSDCPTDECDDADNTDPQNPVVGHCKLSGHPCLENFECDTITCVEGGCFIGRNCAPSNDRSCPDLAPAPVAAP